jgi:hypothetical protein
LEAAGNLAIVCRRQSVRGAPCNFFWIADDLVIDGYIRSDNRGSESVFPLWLTATDSVQNTTTPNFAARFCGIAQQQLGDVTPLALFRYSYALFHSSTYRERYAEPLASSFPRVPLPASRELFEELAALGERLIDWHLLRTQAESVPSRWLDQGLCTIAAGYPRFESGAAFTSAERRFAPLGDEAWNFRVGPHQVLRKWLKDRRGRTLTDADVAHYWQMVQSVEQSLMLVREIEAAISSHGGWPTAFCAK